MCPDGFYILADSAFVQKPPLDTRVLVPLTKPKYRLASPEQQELHKNVVGIRQAAEWAVRDVKGSYKRLRSILPTDSATRLRLFKLGILLHNFRTNQLGLSHVRTV